MAKKNISINTLINKAMHRPVVKSTGEVMYPVIEGYSGALEGGTGNKSQEYLAKTKTAYNSPTNIRRLFITYDSVTVEYFAVPVLPNDAGKLRNRIKFSTVMDSSLGVSNFLEVGKKMWTYQEDLNRYITEKQINSKATAPDEYVVSGNIFGVLSNTYACNNIEEVYVDWTLMLCNDLRPMIQRDAILGERMLLDYIQGNVPFSTRYDDNRILEGLFRRFNSLDGGADIKKRFPRLKVIAFVPRLNKIIEMMEDPSCSWSANSIMPTKNNDTLESMAKRAMSLIDMPGSTGQTFSQAGVFYRYIQRPMQGKPVNTEFRIKDQQYKFDREKLKTFAAMYRERTASISMAARYGDKSGAGEAGADAANLSEEEKYIKGLLDADPESARTVLTIACIGHSKRDIEDLLVTLSKPTRKRVAEIIGFDLSKLKQ